MHRQSVREIESTFTTHTHKLWKGQMIASRLFCSNQNVCVYSLGAVSSWVWWRRSEYSCVSLESSSLLTYDAPRCSVWLSFASVMKEWVLSIRGMLLTKRSWGIWRIPCCCVSLSTVIPSWTGHISELDLTATGRWLAVWVMTRPNPGRQVTSHRLSEFVRLHNSFTTCPRATVLAFQLLSTSCCQYGFARVMNIAVRRVSKIAVSYC
jgi:hypothetical protein